MLIATECGLGQRRNKEVAILKMDVFDGGMEQRINDALPDQNVRLKTILAFAEKPMIFHEPIVFDYVANRILPAHGVEP